MSVKITLVPDRMFVAIWLAGSIIMGVNGGGGGGQGGHVSPSQILRGEHNIKILEKYYSLKCGEDRFSPLFFLLREVGDVYTIGTLLCLEN